MKWVTTAKKMKWSPLRKLKKTRTSQKRSRKILSTQARFNSSKRKMRLPCKKIRAVLDTKAKSVKKFQKILCGLTVRTVSRERFWRPFTLLITRSGRSSKSRIWQSRLGWATTPCGSGTGNRKKGKRGCRSSQYSKLKTKSGIALAKAKTKPCIFSQSRNSEWVPCAWETFLWFWSGTVSFVNLSNI